VDLATIIGIIAGVGLIITAILQGGSAGAFIDVKSVLIVLGGTMAATLISFPIKTVFSVFNIVKKTFLHKDAASSDVIKAMINYAEKARKEGMLSLEQEAENEPDTFLKKGLMLAVDGTESELLSRIMENELGAVESRHNIGRSVLDTMGTLSPAFGMIGTLVGLVQMLANMNDPSSIGPGMAVALLTTFYGAFMANVFFIPMSEKLKNRSKDEVMRMELILEGIMSIKAGDTPRVVSEKLKSFIAPKEKKQFEQEQERD